LTLEVLYLKGLRQVSDEGTVTVTRSCLNLQALDTSFVAITDTAGLAIGQNLYKLRARYMRDNYLLTNPSIDTITQRCRHLEQLTLWGCIELDHLSFDPMETIPNKLLTSSRTSTSPLVPTCLVTLNLWGCHRLRDESALQFRDMKQLKTLILSECHQISDEFVVRCNDCSSILKTSLLCYKLLAGFSY
jgi:hypothetical protein